jgi:hypothetical protein
VWCMVWPFFWSFFNYRTNGHQMKNGVGLFSFCHA